MITQTKSKSLKPKNTAAKMLFLEKYDIFYDCEEKEIILSCGDLSNNNIHQKKDKKSFKEDDKQEKAKQPRARPTLRTKKFIVDQYYGYLRTNKSNTWVSINLQSSVLEYVEEINCNPSNQTKLHVSNLANWIKAERRGEYLSWHEINNLDSRTCQIISIIRHIDYVLKTKYPSYGIYNQVSKSKSMPGEYGVIARRFTPAGTFLGFCEGEVIDGLEASHRLFSQEHMFTSTENRFIDTKDWFSCFARYYNCALKACDQNVCVERLTSQSNPQKVICFTTNKDVQKGEEFLISFASACWEGAADTSPPGSPFSWVHNTLLCEMPAKYETVKPLLTNEDVLMLAAAYIENLNNDDVSD
jgi:hypothetical protein